MALDSRTVNVASVVPLFPSANDTSETETRGGSATTIIDQLLIVPPKTPSTSSDQVPSVVRLSNTESGDSGRKVPVNGGVAPLMVAVASSEKTVLRNCGPRSVAVIGTRVARVPLGATRVALMKATSPELMLMRTSRSPIPRSSVTVRSDRDTAKNVSGFGVSVELNTY